MSDELDDIMFGPRASPKVVVWHAAGHSVYPTQTFAVDDKSAVLMVYTDDTMRRTLAAFNREYWIHVDIVEHDQLPAGDGSEGVTDA